ncbi:AAA family ATPase [Cytophagaceae bacterium DM2B3-1]|uniref:AAA family ATPase n=2 Tax=Xanthocytophaga TaxID=3078918 RepID=A0AAE3UAS9_9BACT|nr:MULTISPECIES: AAA family ATPase [Xanthocytophaga]MDJ1472468.1 AAA family ATPase [Xanthocytophaga flavus]MDJ1483663.1 AAA family ATPase [Xanthocytophaga flavus]MDJ1497810.1 AAA family ATPase [Xanthocytophaga flavus]MDJ1499372.1 AAA family ATPase [Xanthocytophaga agilis]
MNLITIIGGGSGTGKSYSLHNLGKDAVVLNVERKMLPFQSKGLVNVPINSTFKLFEAINRLRDNDEFRIIILDSFSEFCDILLAECKNKAKGFDVWNLYNTEIFNLFQALKSLKNKYVFVVGHTETLMDSDGERIQRLKVKGKENEGMIEKNATCVFYSKTVRRQDGNGVDYKFITNTDGYLPAKTPFGMFKDFLVENDLAAIVKVYDAFYHESAMKLAEAA